MDVGWGRSGEVMSLPVKEVGWRNASDGMRTRMKCVMPLSRVVDMLGSR